MTKKAIYRYDKGEIKSARFTPEGFLSVDAIVTRTGVFLYRNADGTLRRELRHPDDIMKEDSLKSMEMIPITLLHPQERVVDSLNASKLSKGTTGQSVVVDGKFIKNRLLITDQDAIDAILNGTQELSCGYKVTVIDDSGEYDNEGYDFKQTDVVYNHLAIVPAGRAGPEVKIKLDSDDAYQCVGTDKKCSGKCGGECKCDSSKKYIGKYTIDNKELAKTHKDSNKQNKSKEKRMDKIRIDGIEYEAAPEVINALTKANSRGDKAEKDLKTAADEKSKLQAKLDETDEKLKKSELANNDEVIQTAVTARLDLVSQATPHLDEETVKKIDKMSTQEIKVAVIKSHFPEFNSDDRDEVYLDARYDGAIEMKKEDNNGGSSMSSQRSATGASKSTHNDKNIDQDAARKKMVNDQQDAWKNPESK